MGVRSGTPAALVPGTAAGQLGRNLAAHGYYQPSEP